MKPQETAQERAEKWLDKSRKEWSLPGKTIELFYDSDMKLAFLAGEASGERITLERFKDVESNRIALLESALVDIGKIARSFRKEYDDDSYDTSDVVEHHLMLFGETLTKHQELLSEIEKDGK